MIGVFTTAFPDVIVGDIEPFPAASNQIDWTHTFSTWINSFRQLTPHKIAFLQLDFNWRDPTITQDNPDISDSTAVKNLAREVAEFAKTQGIPLGMIINGKALAHSDSEWFAEAEQNMNVIVASRIPLTQIVYAS